LCDTCSASQVCEGHACISCDGVNEPCCSTNPACGGQAICDIGAGHCLACGSGGEPCCDSAICAAGYICTLGTCISTTAVAVGSNAGSGISFQWNGSAWSGPTTVSGTQNLFAIWGANAADVWAVGSGVSGGVVKGVAVHWNGSTWQAPIAIPGSFELFAVR